MKLDIGISGAIIVSAHNEYRPYIGSVGVLNCRIAVVKEGHMDRGDCNTWIDGTGKILMPGLVNGHCHGDMTLARGFGDDLTLLEQNNAFADTSWFYSLLQDEDRFYSRQLTYCEALLSGTTFIMENMYWGLGMESIRAMTEVGIRGALAEDVRENFANAEILLSNEKIEDFIKACTQHQIIPVLGGISEEDYSTELLKRICCIANEKNLILTCHLAENDWRQEIIKEAYGTTSIKYLFEQNLMTNNMLGSHVVYASKEEIGMLVERNIKVVNTPLCEMKIADGIAPISEMVKQGVCVCLGTDGAMWNNSNDIFREMKGMSLLQTIHQGIRSLTKKDILDMATINGAKCFGLDSQYGTIEVGKMADFILIDTLTPHMQPMIMGSHETVTSALVYNATGQDVTDVFVNGTHVVKERVLQTINVTYVMEKVQKASEKIARALSS